MDLALNEGTRCSGVVIWKGKNVASLSFLFLPLIAVTTGSWIKMFGALAFTSIARAGW